MTKKSKTLLGIIVVELTLLIWAFVPKNNSTIAEQKTKFTLDKDTYQQITRFEFGKIILQKQGNQWILNQKYQADKNTVNDFFEILKRLEIKRPVSQSKQKQITKNLMEDGLKFTAFSGTSELLSFYVDGEEKSTFALLDGSDQAFEVYVQGFNVLPYKVFKSREIRWRNKTVMQTNWMSIKKIEVKYRDNPSNNFLIEFDSTFYKVAGIQHLDSARLYNYLKKFEQVRAFQIIDDLSVRDSLKMASPYCTIELQDIDSSRNNILQVYGSKHRVMGLSSQSEYPFLFHPQRFIQTYLMPRRIFEKRK